MSSCSCCGNEYGAAEVTALQCRPDVSVCRMCAEWLVRRHEDAAGGRRLREIVPIFMTTDLDAALERFRRLGFATHAYEDVYGFADRDGVSLHIAVVRKIDLTATSCAAYLYVADADALHAEWTQAGVEGRFHGPTDTDYGLREGAYVDPDGNLIRYGSSL
jgi:catechol 2,3-dioxygenase-like lactoylglutathione lyase family enzyme